MTFNTIIHKSVIFYNKIPHPPPNMPVTPNIVQHSTFETPLKQLISEDLNTPPTSPVSPPHVLKQKSQRVANLNRFNFNLPTPGTSAGCAENNCPKINTKSLKLASPSSPLIPSPISLKLSSPEINDSDASANATINTDSHIKTINKYIPRSNYFNEDDIIEMIQDSTINLPFALHLNDSNIIGKGSNSVVFKSFFNNSSDLLFAVKIPKSIRNSKPIYKEFINFKIISNYLSLNSIDIENFPILNLYGLTYLSRNDYPRIRVNEVVPCLLSSYESIDLERLLKTGGNNNDLINANNSIELYLNSNLWWKLAKQLIMGLIVFRDCNIVHLDMKTSNILFNQKNQDFKIADFTSSGLINDVRDEYHLKKANGLSMDLTLQYCSPELLSSEPNFKSDLYSTGLILLSSAIGQEPYQEILNESSLNQSNLIFKLTELIKNNKIIDSLSNNSLLRLNSNPIAFNLIKLILIERADLDIVIKYLEEIDEIN